MSHIALWLSTSTIAAVMLGLPSMPASADDAQPLCFGQVATITGTDGDDTITGTEGNDVIVGLGGNDSIEGLHGDDLICGTEDGGGSAPGWASGGPGDDQFDSIGVTYADAPRDVVVDLQAGTAVGWGRDTLRSVDRLRGSSHDDQLVGNDTPLQDGECGCDTIEGLGGNDYLRGERGWDFLSGGRGDDVLYGDDGSDTLLPGSGSDAVRGNGGRGDTISYFTSRRAVVIDLAAGTAVGAGRDDVTTVENAIGTRFADRLSGNSRDNLLSGAAGPDLIRGRGGRDVLFGDEGRDRLLGGHDRDEARGGSGTDTCLAETTSACELPR